MNRKTDTKRETGRGTDGQTERLVDEQRDDGRLREYITNRDTDGRTNKERDGRKERQTDERTK